MTTITTIGLDIAKSSFTAHCADATGRTVKVVQLKRSQVEPFFASQPPCEVGLEACGAGHHWARLIAKLGHEARLIPTERVKRLVIRQKNDTADAKATTKARRDPEMRFVPIKTVEQQASLMLFKARDLLIGQRTQLINAIRGHFAELGMVVPTGPKEVQSLIERLDADPGLPQAMRLALKPLASTLYHIGAQIAGLDRAIIQANKANDTAKRLAEVPTIGPLGAMVLSASITAPQEFKNGRAFAAYLGLVPQQYTTGGKPKLGSITKMGNRDIRRLLVMGAIAALARMKTAKRPAALAQWALKLLEVKPYRLVAVALANKVARIAWVIMAKGARYDAGHGLAAPTVAA